MARLPDIKPKSVNPFFVEEAKLVKTTVALEVTDEITCDVIPVTRDVAEYIDTRTDIHSNLHKLGFYLTDDYHWKIVRDNQHELVLVMLRKG